MEQSGSTNTSFSHRLVSFLGVNNIAELSVVLSLPVIVAGALFAWWAIPPAHQPPLSKLDKTLAAFDSSKDDFQVQLMTLKEPGTTDQAFTVANAAAIEDIVRRTEDVRKLRELDPTQEARWKELDAKIVEDKRSLESIPRHDNGSLILAYRNALRNFQSELTAGEKLLEGPMEGADSFQAADGRFIAAERALVNQQIALGRLEHRYPSQVEGWNADKHDLEIESERLNTDWNYIEAHDGGEATAPYQN